VTEAQLIPQARSGDADAWEALTRLHQEPIFRFAYLLLGDADEAQDVAQETFVRAFFGLDRFEDGRPLRPWLIRIASRLSNNRHRAAARYLRALGRLEHETPTVTDEHRQDAEELWTAVQRLRPQFREVIYLRYFLELNEDEMATAINAPPGTVKSRLHRGLRDLRALIAREYPGLMESFAA
jgi:RNA polymerase sigma-70 factor (ECF subfamily)